MLCLDNSGPLGVWSFDSHGLSKNYNILSFETGSLYVSLAGLDLTV